MIKPSSVAVGQGIYGGKIKVPCRLVYQPESVRDFQQQYTKEQELSQDFNSGNISSSLNTSVLSMSSGNQKTKQVSFQDYTIYSNKLNEKDASLTKAISINNASFDELSSETSRNYNSICYKGEVKVEGQSSQSSRNLSDIKKSIKSRLNELQRRIQQGPKNFEEEVAILDQRITDSVISDIEDQFQVPPDLKHTLVTQESFKATPRLRFSLEQQSPQHVSSLLNLSDKYEIDWPNKTGQTSQITLQKRDLQPNESRDNNRSQYQQNQVLISQANLKDKLSSAKSDPIREVGKNNIENFKIRDPQNEYCQTIEIKNQFLQYQKANKQDSENLSRYKIDPKQLGGNNFGRSASSSQLIQQLDSELDSSFQKHSELKQIKLSINLGLKEARKLTPTDYRQQLLPVYQLEKPKSKTRLSVKSMKDYQVHCEEYQSSQIHMSRISDLKKQQQEQITEKQLQKQIETCIISFQNSNNRLKESRECVLDHQSLISSQSFIISSPSFITNESLSTNKQSNVNQTTNENAIKERQMERTYEDKKYKESVKKLITAKVSDWIGSSSLLERQQNLINGIKPLLLASSYKKNTSVNQSLRPPRLYQLYI